MNRLSICIIIAALKDERGHHEPHRDAVGDFLKAVDDRAFVDDFDLQFQLTAGEGLEHAVDASR